MSEGDQTEAGWPDVLVSLYPTDSIAWCTALTTSSLTDFFPEST